MSFIRLLTSTFFVASVLCQSAAASLNDGLVAHYPLDGNAWDESGNGRHGAVAGGIAFVPGVLKQAAHFDGVDDLIRLPNGVIEQETFSVSMYIRPEEGNANGGIKPYRVFDAWSGGEVVALEYGESINRDYSGINYSGVNDYLVGSFHPTYSNTLVFGEQHLYYKTPSSFKATWHPVVLSYDGTIARFYVDGILVNKFVFDESVRHYYSYPDRANYLASINYTLGASLRHLTFYSGLIDDVRIYDRAISQEEVLALLPLAVPKLSVVAPLDQAVHVSVQQALASKPPSKYKIEISDGNQLMTKTYPADDGGGLNVVVKGLTNGISYALKAFPVDETEAAGPPSETIEAKPQGASSEAEAICASSPPLLFVHGVLSGSGTWDTTREYFNGAKCKTFANTFTSPNDNACVQMMELAGFVDTVRNTTGKKPILIGHSQGGLVSRAFLQFGPELPRFASSLRIENNSPLLAQCLTAIGYVSNTVAPLFDRRDSPVAGLITYGTPHTGQGPDLGSFFPLLLETSQFIGLLNDFSLFPLNGDVKIVSMTGRRTRTSESDCVVSAASQNLDSTGYEGLNHKSFTFDGIIHASNFGLRLGCLSFLTTAETEHVDAYRVALGHPTMEILLKSPADIVVRSPSGKTVSKERREIWGTNYAEIEDESGHITTLVSIPYPEPGNYEIDVIPHADAAPDAVYSLEVIDASGQKMVLADQVRVADAPTAPYTADVPMFNIPPMAKTGAGQTVRLGSPVRLDGTASTDADKGPMPLRFSWKQTVGADVSLDLSNAATPAFTPHSPGIYSFELLVNDGAANSAPASLTITVPKLGDIDLDGDVDNNDLNVILAARNKPASSPNDLRDLDGNMKIDALDARKLTTLCTRPRCATQ